MENDPNKPISLEDIQACHDAMEAEGVSPPEIIMGPKGFARQLIMAGLDDCEIEANLRFRYRGDPDLLEDLLAYIHHLRRSEGKGEVDGE